MKSVRSDSSLPLRRKLNHDYLILPDILTSIPIDVYIRFAWSLVEDAKLSWQQRDLSRSYVQKKKMVAFVLNKLPTHPNWTTAPLAKLAIVQAAKQALIDLEAIVAAMDTIEDRKREEANSLSLIDAFDGIDDEGETQPADIDRVISLLPTMAPLLSTASLNALRVNDDFGESALSPYAELPEMLTLSSPESFAAAETATAPSYELYAAHPHPAPVLSNLKRSEKEILQCLTKSNSYRCFAVPYPHTTTISLAIGDVCIQMLRDDFHVQFTPFLRDIPTALHVSESAIETNRLVSSICCRNQWPMMVSYMTHC